MIKTVAKTLLAMVLCIVVGLQAAAQNTPKVTVNISGRSLKNVIEAIEKQTQYVFSYRDDVIASQKTAITLNMKNQPVNKVLDKALTGTDLTYEIVSDKSIILSRKDTKKAARLSDKKVTIRGRVLGADGEPLVGASVLVDGTDLGVATDIDGNYSLSDVPDNADVVISYIGCVPQSIKASDSKALSEISLKDDNNLLDEVVVVGYGTMKKKDLTGAVSQVKMSDEPIGTISSISHALAGKAAGLQVSTVSAQPGSSASFRIRGAASVNAGNDPLVIIDGFPVNPSSDPSAGRYDAGATDNVLGSLNPNDIESIEVLKDASSTAIYGARAGNGVIIVTTKKGKSGAPKVSYTATGTVQRMARKYDVLDAVGFMTERNRYGYESWLRDNKIGIYGNNSVANASKPYTPYYSQDEINNPANDTDWLDLVTRTGFQTKHDVSVTGGTDWTKYLVSGSYFRQNGVIKNSDSERYTIRINLDQKLAKELTLGVNLSLSSTNNDNVPLGSGQNEYAGILVSAAQFSPVIAVKDEDGNYNLNTEAAFLPNPVSLLEVTDKTNKERVLGTAFLEYKPFSFLTLKANFGIDRRHDKRSTYLPKTTLYGQKKNGDAEIATIDHTDYLMEFTANFNTKFGENHRLNALAGYSFQRFTSSALGGGNNDFLIDGFLYNNLGAGAAPKPSIWSSADKSEMASFFGRVNYTFMDRYLLTATLRADGASNFAKNHRWGYFPSVALGWRFGDESFMENLREWLSNGKLRLSYGKTGNANIGNQAISYYRTGYNNEFGGKKVTGVYLQQMGNPDLKWESTAEFNIGLDLGFFNNRLNVTTEYFNRKVSDLLSTRSLLSFQEVESIAANIGKTKSQGFELTINTTNIDTRDFSWTTDATFSFYRDKWDTRDPSWKPSAYSQYHSPIRYMAGYQADGIIQVGEDVPWMPGAIPGQIKIKDIDGYDYNSDGSIKVDQYGIPLKTGKPDGRLNDTDKVIYGCSDPGYLAGFNNSFRYRAFDLNIYFYGQFNVLTNGCYKDTWITGSSGYTGIVNLFRGYNMPVTATDVWSSDNQSGSLPGYFQSDSTWGTGDYFLKKSWFIRCRNITLGYTIPVKGISKLRVYADVNNPFCISPYKGLDLETDNNSWAYPNVRSYSLGFDITF